MKKIKLNYEMKPCSLNSAYGNNSRGRHYTVEAEIWLNHFFKETMLKRAEIKAFCSLFDQKLHFIEIDYFFFFPKDQIFTKKGTIKKRRWDRCNLTKIPNDELSKVMGIDDAIFCDGKIVKLTSPNDKFYFTIIMEIKTISILEENSSRFYDLFFQD